MWYTYVRVYIQNYSVFHLPISSYQNSRADERRPILNVSQINYAIVAVVTLVILMAGIESGRNVDTSSTYVSVSLQYCWVFYT